MSGAHGDVPVDALVWHVDRRELNGGFPTVGFLLTGIQSLAGYAHRTWGRNDSEQWVCILDIVIKRQVQTVA